MHWPFRRKPRSKASAAKRAADQQVVDHMKEMAKAAEARKASGVKPQGQARPAGEIKSGTRLGREIAKSMKRGVQTEQIVKQRAASDKVFIGACAKIGVTNTGKAFENAYKILNEASKEPLLSWKKKVNELTADTMFLRETDALEQRVKILAKALSLMIEKGLIKKQDLV